MILAPSQSSVLMPTRRGQFSLLNQSLNADLRGDTLSAILNRTLKPAQVANLTNVELASSARLAQLEAAKQERLASIVKPKEEQAATIRMGRDGLERAEDTREKEMGALRHAEEAQRARELERERRESMMTDEGSGPAESPRVAQDQTPVPQSPAIATPRSATRPDTFRKPSGGGPLSPRKSVSESPTIPPPTGPQRQFSLSSAWGKGPEAEGGDAPGAGLGIGNGDQSTLDLSDIVMEPVEEDDLVSSDIVDDSGKTEMEIFEALPVVWSGGVSILIQTP